MPDMTIYMCHGCGVQYGDAPAPPPSCVVCTDDRQYVEWEGQTWTTSEELSKRHAVRVELDGDLIGIGITPRFAIPQRALLVESDAGNIMWDCISLVTPDAVADIERRGGLAMIAISHPHFYSAMVDWSDAFGGIPILIHSDDRSWVQRTSRHVTFWEGDTHQLSPTVTLYRCGGHFPGSTVLHWTAAPRGRNVILAGDTVQVAQNRTHVSFIHSAPNAIPMHPDHVETIRARLDGLAIDDIYGFTWGLNIFGNARAALDESFDRYLAAITR